MLTKGLNFDSLILKNGQLKEYAPIAEVQTFFFSAKNWTGSEFLIFMSLQQIQGLRGKAEFSFAVFPRE